MPWLSAGSSALGGLLDLLGMNGADTQQTAITGLQNSPLFQSEYRQGTEAILQNSAATGGLRGGNTQHSLFNLGSDLLAQVIQQQIGNLGGISGAGANTGAQLGGFGANSANAISQLFGNIGQAKAGGILGQAQGFAQAGTSGGFIIPIISKILGF